MKKIALFMFFLLFVITSLAHGDFRNGNTGEVHPSITGTIQKLERNYLEILDESDGQVKRLSYFPGRESFQSGERVPVWFDKRFGNIERIKRMTPPVYTKGKQNLGYILPADPSP